LPLMPYSKPITISEILNIYQLIYLVYICGKNYPHMSLVV
jgi:hypothetical protein